MSSKVAFQVHYGDFYRITHDSYGVNLSALERRQCSLDKPLERSFESIRKCLHKMFNVNSKTRLLTVHTLTSWETNGNFWELTHISSTEEWQHGKPFSQWMDGAPNEKWSLLYDRWE